jgi:hypothetical protein
MSPQNNPGLILSELTLEMVPRQPAVYAILSDGEVGSSNKRCRYVGFTEDLRDAVLKHFQPGEPIVPLRYFMLSSKLKYLLYELLPNNDKSVLFKRTEEWMEEFNMASSSQEREDAARFNFA